MRIPLASFLITAVLGTSTTACGGDGGTGSGGALYQDVAGEYTGAFSGDDQGTALAAVMTISLEQDHSQLDGWFHWSGAIDDGDVYLEVFLGGELTGSLTTGDSPSISLAATVPSCPGYAAAYTASHDPASRTLTIEGQIDVLSPYCNVAFSYDLSIPLEWQGPPTPARQQAERPLAPGGRANHGRP